MSARDYEKRDRARAKLVRQMAEFCDANVASRGGGWFVVSDRNGAVQGHAGVIRLLYWRCLRKALGVDAANSVIACGRGY